MNAFYAVVVAGLAWLFLRRGDQLPGQGGAVGGWMPSFEFLPAGPQVEDAAWMPSADPLADSMPDQVASPVEVFVAQAQAVAQDIPAALGFGGAVDIGVASRNERAFLDMIAYAEGTAGPNGYRTLFGGGLFDGFADHPRQFFTFTDGAGRTLRTSAAGRYQFLGRTWDTLRARLDLPDFGPRSQDLAALELIRERGALADVQAGRITTAIAKVAPIWASLPGAGYAQPERKLSSLLAAYASAGGNMEA